MKRFWLGVAIMTLLLALGIGATVATGRSCRPIAQALEQAAQLDKEQVTALSEEARSTWHRHRRFCAAVSDHEPMEEIDALFEELRIYLRCDDRVHYLECCARLATQIHAIADAQAVNWWNIF